MRKGKNKTESMRIRLTNEEFIILKQVADSMQITLSDYVRSQVFKPAKVRSLITRKQKEAAGKGGNKVAALSRVTAGTS